MPSRKRSISIAAAIFGMMTVIPILGIGSSVVKAEGTHLQMARKLSHEECEEAATRKRADCHQDVRRQKYSQPKEEYFLMLCDRKWHEAENRCF